MGPGRGTQHHFLGWSNSSPVAGYLDNAGFDAGPFDSFLVMRSLKTLQLRMERHSSNAQAVAEYLAGHGKVETVHYPGLKSHPQYERARELFSGCGGMLSFELEGGPEAALRFMKRVRIPIGGPSLGGVETLLSRPCVTSHAGMTAEARATLGIGDGLIRLSVGIEAVEELIDDFGQALASG